MITEGEDSINIHFQLMTEGKKGATFCFLSMSVGQISTLALQNKYSRKSENKFDELSGATES